MCVTGLSHKIISIFNKLESSNLNVTKKSQSADQFFGWAFTNDWRQTKMVAERLGFGENSTFLDSPRLKECFRKKPIEQIWEATYFTVRIK